MGRVAIRLLVVDDHAAVLDSMVEAMSAAGLEVVGTAASGYAAVRCAATVRPDVVILDVQLPDVTGFEVVEALHRCGALVILTSSRSEIDYGNRVRESSAEGFIPKHELTGARVREIVHSAATGGR
jgi:DNA-binding NarL/FixJ family response regulator